MAGKINAYYDGISKEIQAKCQSFVVSVEHKIEIDQSMEDDYKLKLLQDINEIKEIEEIVGSDLSNDDKEDTYKECMRIVDSRINNFSITEFQDGLINNIKLDSSKYSLILDKNENEIECTVVSKESGVEISIDLDPKEAIEFLHYMDNLGFGDMETKIELAKEFLEPDNPEEVEKKQETAEDDNSEKNVNTYDGAGFENNSPLI